MESVSRWHENDHFFGGLSLSYSSSRSERNQADLDPSVNVWSESVWKRSRLKHNGRIPYLGRWGDYWEHSLLPVLPPPRGTGSGTPFRFPLDQHDAPQGTNQIDQM